MRALTSAYALQKAALQGYAAEKPKLPAREVAGIAAPSDLVVIG